MTLPKPNAGWLIPILAVVTGIVFYLLEPPSMQGLRNLVFDHYQRWEPRQYRDVPVRIIDIDEESLARLGQWPWPRTRVAELVNRLREAGAASIAFDFMFAEPDRTSPAAIMKIWEVDPQQRSALEKLPDHDVVLARALAPGGVVLGHALLRSAKPPAHFASPFRVVEIGPSPLPYLSPFEGTVPARPALQDAAAGNGAVTFIPEGDGIVRRVPLLLNMGGRAVPSLVAEALRVAQDGKNLLVKTDAASGTGIEAVQIGEVTVPTTPDGQVWVHYSRPDPERYIPAWKVLAAEVPVEKLRGHILVVGTSAQGLMDLRFSPLGGMIPGVESHAQALEGILLGDHLTRPHWGPGLEMLVIAVGGLLVGFVGLSVGAMMSAASVLTILTLTGFGSWYAYAHFGLLLDPVTPGLVMTAIFMFSSLHHHASAEMRQRWVRKAFSRYVSPNLVSYLVDNPRHLELGGTRRECSFIFTDLAGFTNLMEKLDPAEAVRLLNDYLDHMIQIAFEHNGTLDRIVGDAVAIMFSAPVEQPDHRQRAMACAMAMHRYARRHAAEANARGVPFGATRIGIHTGEVTVGNFGGSTIFDYRALGDPVNTAARLESVNKQLGTLVCVSEATLSGCTDTPARPVGKLVLKGKTEPLMVYQPIIPDEGQAPAPDLAYAAAYQLMAASAPDALEAFEKLALERPGDPLVALHLARLRRGDCGEVIVFTEK